MLCLEKRFSIVLGGLRCCVWRCVSLLFFLEKVFLAKVLSLEMFFSIVFFWGLKCYVWRSVFLLFFFFWLRCCVLRSVFLLVFFG